MRHHTALIALILAAVMLTACARPTTLERLTRLQERGIMSGHQDDTFYGLTWNARAGDSTSSDIKLVCGDYPAVMGFELGGLELGQERNLDSVPFRLMRREILAQIRRGGFVTISWHPYNIVTNGNAWDNSDTTVVARILPGGTHHAQFITWLDRIADFLNTVRSVLRKISHCFTAVFKLQCRLQFVQLIKRPADTLLKLCTVKPRFNNPFLNRVCHIAKSPPSMLHLPFSRIYSEWPG